MLRFTQFSTVIVQLISTPNTHQRAKWTTDDRSKPNKWSSSYTSLFAIYFAVPLVAVRLNYKSVIESCVFTDHSIQNIIHFRIIIIALFISDEQFLCSAFSKYRLDICTMLFLSALHSTMFLYKCLVTGDLLRVTESHSC